MKNEEYWKQRAEMAILQSEASVLDYETELKRVYNVSLLAIQKDVDAFYGKYADKNKITYAEARKRLTNIERLSFEKQIAEWQRVAAELGMSTNYSAYLEKLGAKVYISRLESLTESIRFELEKLAQDKQDGMKEVATNNYIAAYYTNYFNLSSAPEMAVKFAAVDSRGVEIAIKTRWSGANYSDRIYADKDRLIKALQTTIPQTFSRGLSSDKLGDMLAKELGISQVRGRALARTETNYLCNQAALDVYKAAGLVEYSYLATLDMRTSEICRDLDGYVGKVTQAEVGVNYPPMHVNCRSTTIPFFLDDTSTDRIARDEEGNNITVPKGMTQVQWIKKYVPEEQQASLLKFIGKYKPKQ